MTKLFFSLRTRRRSGAGLPRNQAFSLAAYGIVLACVGLGLFSAGCTEERDANDTIDFQLNLNLPEVMEREIIV